MMAAVIQSLQLNFECTANVSSTSTASRKEMSRHNQFDWQTAAVVSAAVDLSKTARIW